MEKSTTRSTRVDVASGSSLCLPASPFGSPRLSIALYWYTIHVVTFETAFVHERAERCSCGSGSSFLLGDLSIFCLVSLAYGFWKYKGHAGLLRQPTLTSCHLANPALMAPTSNPLLPALSFL